MWTILCIYWVQIRTHVLSMDVVLVICIYCNYIHMYIAIWRKVWYGMVWYGMVWYVMSCHVMSCHVMCIYIYLYIHIHIYVRIIVRLCALFLNSWKHLNASILVISIAFPASVDSIGSKCFRVWVRMVVSMLFYRFICSLNRRLVWLYLIWFHSIRFDLKDRWLDGGWRIHTSDWVL